MNDLQILAIAILLILNIISNTVIGIGIHYDLQDIKNKLDNFLK
jgi:hypothetical protein